MKKLIKSLALILTVLLLLSSCSNDNSSSSSAPAANSSAQDSQTQNTAIPDTSSHNTTSGQTDILQGTWKKVDLIATNEGLSEYLVNGTKTRLASGAEVHTLTFKDGKVYRKDEIHKNEYPDPNTEPYINEQTADYTFDGNQLVIKGKKDGKEYSLTYNIRLNGDTLEMIDDDWIDVYARQP